MGVATILAFARYRQPDSQMIGKTKANDTSQDATYKSSSCSSRCTDDDWGDVVYNSNTNLWACCGTNVACNNPTNETFLAPPPQQLLAAALSQSATNAAAASSHPATTVISTSISSATVTLTSTAVGDHTSSLNEGAKAGIGVGAALAGLIIIALLAWVTLLRKRLRNLGPAQYTAGKRDGSMLDEGLSKQAPPHAVREHELSGYARPHEMEGR